MKEKVKKIFWIPFLRCYPGERFLLYFSEKDIDFFTSRIGQVVVDEYKKSGYLVTKEILKFTDMGVEVVRQYPVK